MHHELALAGHRFGLRPARMEDAAFILSLRSDPELGRWLHPTSPRLEDQKAWMAAYLRRPGDYYFVIADQRDGALVGTIGIYDVDEARAEAEWGRWLVREGSLAAVESVLLMYRIAFEQLGLNAVYSRTVAGNLSVVSFHDSLGAERARTLPDHVELGGSRHDSVEHRMDAERFGTVRSRLDALARRIAQA